MRHPQPPLPLLMCRLARPWHAFVDYVVGVEDATCSVSCLKEAACLHGFLIAASAAPPLQARDPAAAPSQLSCAAAQRECGRACCSKMCPEHAAGQCAHNNARNVPLHTMSACAASRVGVCSSLVIYALNMPNKH